VTGTVKTNAMPQQGVGEKETSGNGKAGIPWNNCVTQNFAKTTKWNNQRTEQMAHVHMQTCPRCLDGKNGSAHQLKCLQGL